ncbi:hypothetical protein D3C85_691660 [compost metagenome]
MPLVEADCTDVHPPARRFGIRILGIEGERPVGATVLQSLQACNGFGEIDARNHHSLHQQGQRRDAQLDPLEIDHLRLLRPIRVAQAQVLGHHMGPRHPGAPASLVDFTLPDHRQVAIDREGTVQLFGHLGIEVGFDPVPVKEQDDHDQRGHQQHQAGEGPGEYFSGARHCTGLLMITACPSCGARKKRQAMNRPGINTTTGKWPTGLTKKPGGAQKGSFSFPPPSLAAVPYPPVLDPPESLQ